MFCQEQESLTLKTEEDLSFSLRGIVPTHLLPLVVKFLTDTNSQVEAERDSVFSISTSCL